MPATRLERLLALLVLAATIALAVLTALAWVDYADADPQSAAEPIPVATTTALVETRTGETETTEAETTETAATTGTQAEAPVSREAELVLTAARGDCWVQVRAGSADGEVLFAGILEQASTRRFTGERLWLELGAAENVDATINGEPVERLAGGPSTAVVTPAGLTEASTQ